MGTPKQPRFDLAQRVLPAGVLRALTHCFGQNLENVMLVGGTALAGFYAGHRRSDDIDLFTRSPPAQEATRRACESLRTIGATLSNETRSTQYFHASCELEGHRFTIDVALDANLFAVGEGILVDHQICVASLDTLLRMKSAALVSRCSEKDLYDLIWILEHRDIEAVEFLAFGHEIDTGMSTESVLMTLSGTTLRKEACGFGIAPTDSADAIYRQVVAFKEALQRILSEHLHRKPVPPLGQAVRMIRTQMQKSGRKSPTKKGIHPE